MSSANQASFLVCQRYAHALIQQAESVSKLDKVEQDMAKLLSMLEVSDDLRGVILSPLIDQNSLHSTMEALSTLAKLDDVTQKFLGVLVENSRLNLLEKIIDVFGDILSENRGALSVDVLVAQDLSAKQRKFLQGNLSDSLGGDVDLNVQTDPAILGGMIVTVGSKMIDDSVARKLSRLKAAMGLPANESLSLDSNISEAK